MKKFVNAMFLGLSVIVLGCHSLNSEVTVLGKRAAELSVAKRDQILEEDKQSDYPKGSPLLPVNSWDGKMMIW